MVVSRPEVRLLLGGPLSVGDGVLTRLLAFWRWSRRPPGLSSGTMPWSPGLAHTLGSEPVQPPTGEVRSHAAIVEGGVCEGAAFAEPCCPWRPQCQVHWSLGDGILEPSGR